MAVENRTGSSDNEKGGSGKQKLKHVMLNTSIISVILFSWAKICLGISVCVQTMKVHSFQTWHVILLRNRNNPQVQLEVTKFNATSCVCSFGFIIICGICLAKTLFFCNMLVDFDSRKQI